MLTIERTNSENQNFRTLVELLDKELWSRYPSSQATYDQFNKIENNNTVVVIYDSDMPIACGCFKKIDDITAEIKRMFVMQSHRGKGISKLIMNELEQWAQQLGFKRLILETAEKQPEAIGLYYKCGFKKIENYGPYVAFSQSLCMEKLI
jgi:putative acetyltransferase